MITQILSPQLPKGRRTADILNKTRAMLLASIPDCSDHVVHPEYLRPAAEEELFGPQASVVLTPQWRPHPEFDDGQAEYGLPQAGPKNLSRQDEALLFRRYNCARHHLASLMEKQTKRFARGRLPEILTWSNRVLDNRSALVQANMALVVAMAKRTRINYVEFGELVSEGNMALLRAVDKFDFSRGFKFSTYACSAIVRAFGRLVAQARSYSKRFPTNAEPESEQGDDLEQRHVGQLELAVEDLQRVLILNRARLTDVEQLVLGARFALSGHDRVHTLQEVSQIVQLSQERIRQIQKKALTKLRLAIELASSPATTSPDKTGGELGDQDEFHKLSTAFTAEQSCQSRWLRGNS